MQPYYFEGDSFDPWEMARTDDYGMDEYRDEPVLACYTRGCLLDGVLHYRYECFTAEGCEDQMAEAGDAYFAAIRDARWNIEIRIEQAREVIWREILEMGQRARESIGLPRYRCKECGCESCRASDCDGLPF